MLWGIFFLLIIVLGFQVNIWDIWNIATGSRTLLSVFCWYMVASIPMYPILFFAEYSLMQEYDEEVPGICSLIGSEIPITLRIPYKGFDLRGITYAQKLDIDDYWKTRDFEMYVRRFIDTIVWWAIVISGIFAIYHSGENAILTAIEAKSLPMRLITLGIVIAIMLVVGIITGWMRKRSIQEMFRELREYEQSGQDEQK